MNGIIKRVLGEKTNCIYLDNFTENRIAKLTDMLRVILLITEYRNFSVQSYLFILLYKETKPSKSQGFAVRLTILSRPHGLMVIDHFLTVKSEEYLVQENFRF